MRRRKTAVAAGCCLAFLLGTLLNLLFIPGSEHPPPPREELPPSPPGAPLYPPEEEIGGGQAALARQIRERYEEVLRYRQHRAAAAGRRPLRPRERRLMDLAPPRTSAEQPRPPGPRGRAAAGPWAGASAELSLEPPLLGCRDIRDVSGVQYLGSGYTKAVYKAVLNRTLAVALKAVDFGGHDIAHCVRQFSALGDCYRLAAYKIVKEMILLQRLRHANVLQVRGCGRGAPPGRVGRNAFPRLSPSRCGQPVGATAAGHGVRGERARTVPRSSREFAHTPPSPVLWVAAPPSAGAVGVAVAEADVPGSAAPYLLSPSPVRGKAHRWALSAGSGGAYPPATNESPRRGAPGPGRGRERCGMRRVPPPARHPPAAAGPAARALIPLPRKQNEY